MLPQLSWWHCESARAAMITSGACPSQQSPKHWPSPLQLDKHWLISGQPGMSRQTSPRVWQGWPGSSVHEKHAAQLFIGWLIEAQSTKPSVVLEESSDSELTVVLSSLLVVIDTVVDSVIESVVGSPVVVIVTAVVADELVGPWDVVGLSVVVPVVMGKQTPVLQIRSPSHCSPGAHSQIAEPG